MTAAEKDRIGSGCLQSITPVSA